MNARWQRIALEPSQRPLLMDAVLAPHRSLSAVAFKYLFWFFLAANLAIAAFFVAQGAYPVVGFLGLDVLVFWLAFRVNYSAARRRERVQVAPDRIVLTRSTPGRADHWAVSPLWARVSHNDNAGVRIVSGGGAMRVGAFLSPKEQSQFARALDAALWRAKRS